MKKREPTNTVKAENEILMMDDDAGLGVHTVDCGHGKHELALQYPVLQSVAFKHSTHWPDAGLHTSDPEHTTAAP